MERVLAAALLAATACSSADKTQGNSLSTDAGADTRGDARSGAPRLVVTADWLNRSLSLLDYDKLVGGATTRDAALVDTVDLGKYAPGPIEVAVTPDGKTAVVTVGPGFFVGLEGLVGATSIDPGGTLLLVDLETRAVTAELPPPAGPMGIVIAPDGKHAFSVDHGSTQGKTLTMVDLIGKKIVQSIDIGGSPEEAALTPDGTLGAVNTDANGSIRFFDPSDPSTTLSTPLFIGGDPGGSTFVVNEKKLVIGKSLGQPGYAVVDVSNPAAPTVLEAPSLPGVPYGADVIPGTSRVLLTVGVAGAPNPPCALAEVDVSSNPSTLTRTLALPCKGGLPLSTAVDREGAHAFVGVPGDNSLMVVDLGTGDVRRVPWLAQAGPTHVALSR